MNRFLELQIKVQKELLNELKANKLTVIDMMSVLYLLGNSKSEKELVGLLEIFSGDFECLKRILEEEKANADESEQNELNAVIVQLIKDNPKIANEVVKLSNKDDFSKKTLLEAFPESIKYFS